MKEAASKFLTLAKSDFIKALWVFIFSSLISIAGDAIMQAFVLHDYSLSSIHWQEIGAAVAVATIGYLKKQIFTNSKGELFTKDAK